MREACRKMAASWQLHECERIYAERIAQGKRGQQRNPSAVYSEGSSPPGPWEKAGTQDQLRRELAKCRADPKDAERCEQLDYEFRQKFNVAP